MYTASPPQESGIRFFLFAGLYNPGGREEEWLFHFTLVPAFIIVSLSRLLGIRKSCVPLTSGTMSILRGVTKEVFSSAKAGKALRAVWSLFVFLYSTVENDGCFKKQIREV